MQPSRKPYLLQPQVAQLLDVTPRTLANWRKSGKGPAWSKVGGAIRYTPQALADWLADNTRLTGEKPESAPAPARSTPVDIHAVAPVGLGVIIPDNYVDNYNTQGA